MQVVWKLVFLAEETCVWRVTQSKREVMVLLCEVILHDLSLQFSCSSIYSERVPRAEQGPQGGHLAVWLGHSPFCKSRVVSVGVSTPILLAAVINFFEAVQSWNTLLSSRQTSRKVWSLEKQSWAHQWGTEGAGQRTAVDGRVIRLCMSILLYDFALLFYIFVSSWLPNQEFLR